MTLIPPFYLDTVVAVGLPSPEGAARWVASGFIYGRYVGPTDEPGRNLYAFFLVTNRHVLNGHTRRPHPAMVRATEGEQPLHMPSTGALTQEGRRRLGRLSMPREPREGTEDKAWSLPLRSPPRPLQCWARLPAPIDWVSGAVPADRDSVGGSL